MKIILIVVIFIFNQIYSQNTYQITIDNNTTSIDSLDGLTFRNIKEFKILVNGNDTVKYKLQMQGEDAKEFEGMSITFKRDFDITDKIFTIFSGDNSDAAFVLKSTKNENPGDKNVATNQTLQEYFEKTFPKQLRDYTEFGLQIRKNNYGITSYTGSQYVHIFIDMDGNCINATIPQGVSNLQYVVHILYLVVKDNSQFADYSINQTEGEFDGALVFNNSGIELMSGREDTVLVWSNREFLLSTSTSDIKFDVVRTIVDDKSQPFKSARTVLASYTIKMSKVYHGTIDAGFLSTSLANPKYELVNSPTNNDEKVVKKSEESRRGIVTAMATFYFSPIIFIEKFLFGQDIAGYKLYGRNFLDDHEIYERIYPSIGISLNETVFENFFFGLNWEIARGGSLFVGFHYGKINTFNTEGDFKFGETVVNDGGFELRKGTRWLTKLAVGANIDVTIVKSLLGL